MAAKDLQISYIKSAFQYLKALKPTEKKTNRNQHKTESQRPAPSTDKSLHFDESQQGLQHVEVIEASPDRLGFGEFSFHYMAMGQKEKP